MSAPHLVTVKQAAAFLCLSVSAVYDLCHTGALTHFRMGKKKEAIRISQEVLDAYLAASVVPATRVVVPPFKPRKRGQPLEVGYSHAPMPKAWLAN